MWMSETFPAQQQMGPHIHMYNTNSKLKFMWCINSLLSLRTRLNTKLFSAEDSLLIILVTNSKAN